MLKLVIMDAFTKIKFVKQEQDNMIICLEELRSDLHTSVVC